MTRNRYPLNFFLPTDFFLRIDPLSALSVITAGRTIAVKFWPSIIVVISAVIFGRFFCGWICPLGTVIDLSDRTLRADQKRQKSGRLKSLKYIILIIILTGAVFSFQFIFFFDPLVIITRSATIIIFPILYYLIESILIALAGLPVTGDFFFELYLDLKGTALPVQEQSFYQGLPIFIILLAILSLGLISRRYWCRNLCPLGAMLGLLSKLSIFGRYVRENCNLCQDCVSNCKMTAIRKQDAVSNGTECILCLSCGAICPEESIGFKFTKGVKNASPVDISRRKFIGAAAGGIALLGLYKVTPVNINASDRAIRPPGAAEEDKFLDMCLRCQQCVGICSTTGGCLQPAVNEAGFEGLWTPIADMRRGYCEYNCNLCGQVCPSGAIKSLTVEDKQRVIMGTAYFDRNRCIPYYRQEECMVCEEHCPTPDKAIIFRLTQVEKDGESIVLKVPYVDESLCIGCGICENKCPVTGRAGIFITRSDEERIML